MNDELSQHMSAAEFDEAVADIVRPMNTPWASRVVASPGSGVRVHFVQFPGFRGGCRSWCFAIETEASVILAQPRSSESADSCGTSLTNIASREFFEGVSQVLGRTSAAAFYEFYYSPTEPTFDRVLIETNGAVSWKFGAATPETVRAEIERITGEDVPDFESFPCHI